MQKILDCIVRFSFSFMLIFFGLNQFLHFLPDPSYPAEAQAIIEAFQRSGYILYAVGILQLIVGGMLLIDRWVPFGVLLFAPILINVLLFHLRADVAGLPKVLPTFLLYVYFIFKYRSRFISVFINLLV